MACFARGWRLSPQTQEPPRASARKGAATAHAMASVRARAELARFFMLDIRDSCKTPLREADEASRQTCWYSLAAIRNRGIKHRYYSILTDFQQEDFGDRPREGGIRRGHPAPCIVCCVPDHPRTHGVEIDVAHARLAVASALDERRLEPAAPYRAGVLPLGPSRGGGRRGRAGVRRPEAQGQEHLEPYPVGGASPREVGTGHLARWA